MASLTACSGMASGWQLVLISCLAVGQCAVLPVKLKVPLPLPAHKKTQIVNSTCLGLYQKNSHRRSPYRYVPACTEKGNFQQLQCYWQSKFSQVCWCVDPLTGKEIKGTRQRFLESLVACPAKRQKRLSFYPPWPILSWPTIAGFEFFVDSSNSTPTISPNK